MSDPGAHMEIKRAFLDGLSRTNRTGGMLAGLFIISIVVALPLAVTMSDTLESAIGASVVHENLRTGFDMDWYGEFQFGRGDLGTTFSPSIIGAGALLNNVEALLDGGIFGGNRAIVGLGILYGLLWTFFAGGVISIYTDTETYSRERFFGASARYFFRLVQLLVCAGILYFLIYRYVGKPVFEGIPKWTRDWTDERPVLFLNMMAYAFVFFLLALVNMVFDYAKIHTVLYDRRNMIAASARGLMFVLHHPLRTLGLYYLAGIVTLVVMIAYGLIGPGPSQSSVIGVVFAFLIGQAYLLARIWTKLLFWSSQSSMMAAYRPPTTSTQFTESPA